MKWPKVRLGDIGRVAMCKRVLKEFTSSTGDIPFYKIGTFGGKADAYISTDLYETFKAKYSYPTKGNVLISAAGTIGKVVVFDGAPSYFQDSNIVWLEHDGKSLLDSYLYYFLLRHEWQITQGATIQRLYNDDIRNTEINLPPLPIQQKIADVLGAYDDLIENNRRRIELLEKMARELYRERFVRRRGEGTELTLLEVFDFVRGKSYESNEIDVVEGVPMVNLKNIRAWGGYNSGAERLFSGDFKDEQTLGRGDVIMGVTDMTQDRRIVGHVALVPTLDQTATFSMDIIKLIPKDMSNVELYSILQYSGVSQAISQLATGATVLHLRPGALDSVRLWIPRKSDFEKVEELFSGYYSEIDNLILQNRNLAKQRDRLLPRLMSGKLDVSKLVKEGA